MTRTWCSRVVVVLVALVGAGVRAEDAARPRYGHSAHGPAFDQGPRMRGALMEGQGTCRFPVTATAEAQAFVDQGVAQFHGFQWYECERSFREALHRDPDCVMALWGMAMAANGDVWVHRPVARARALADRAVALRYRLSRQGKSLTARENAYLDGFVRLQRTGGTRAGRMAWLDSLRGIVRGHPEDREAKAFLAFALLKNDNLYKPDGSSYLTRPSAAFLREVDGLVDRVLAEQPDHPAHHYKIHIWDYHEPERARGSTDPIGPSEPRIAHMWHMAGHIHWRARRFAETAWQQEASARTDHRYYREQRVMPYLNPNYLHNNDWLTESLGCVGRMHDAMRVSINMIELPRHPRYASFATSSGVRGRDDLMDILNLFERWDEVARLVDSPALAPTETLAEETKRLRLRGLAQYHLGQRAALAATIKELGALRFPTVSEDSARSAPESPDAPPPSSYRTRTDVADNVESQREAWLELSAYEALLAGDRAKARAQLVRLEPFVQPPIDWEDVRKGLLEHQLAQAFAACGDLRKAVAVARSAAAKYPGEVVPQAVLVELLARARRHGEARRELVALARAADHADRDVPVLVRLRERHGLELPARERALRWPNPAQHPPLDTLGPITWAPVDAPAFAVEDDQGRRRALSDYRGKALLLVLNLGRGCSHCNQQLEALGAAHARFRGAGVETLVITDERDRPAARAARARPAYPFPQAAASRKDVFRALRAIDEFEDAPLHGVYLISPDGKILWEDIDADPFVNFEYLAKEAARLLAIWRPRA